MQYEKILVDSPEKLESLTEELESASLIAWDSETNGTFDRFKIALVGLSFCTNEERAYYVPVAHEEGNQLLLNNVIQAIKPVMINESIEKVCHNTKFDEMVIRKYGIDVQGKGHDTFVMNWLLSEDTESRGLKALVHKYFNYKMTTFEEVVQMAPKKRGVDRDYNFARVSLDKSLDYAADDAYWCLKLFNHFKVLLEAEKLWDPYDKLERPFNRILGFMEETGVAIDMDAVEFADKRLSEIAEKIEAEIYKEAGEVFNIKAGAQLGRILFDKLKIGKNVPKSAKTKQYKTDKKTLEKYAAQHKIVENVLRRKKIQKTHSTFVEGTKKYIAKDGRVHASFNGCGTVTGRISGSKPNLQQLEGDEVEEVKVRDFFAPSEGCHLVVADFSQVELRLIAHFSRDKVLTEAFVQGTEDFHDAVARKVFLVADDEEVTRKQRVAAKTLNFGVPYGRGPGAISAMLGIPYPEAAKFIDDWFARFSGVKAYREYVIAKAREVGYVRTISGQKRRLPNLTSTDAYIRGHAERQAFNTRIQGSAGALIKAAMNSLYEPLKQLDANMIIQVHDELVVDAPKQHAEEVVGIMKRIMENPINGKNPLRLPLVVEPVVVDKWSEAK